MKRLFSGFLFALLLFAVDVPGWVIAAEEVEKFPTPAPSDSVDFKAFVKCFDSGIEVEVTAYRSGFQESRLPSGKLFMVVQTVLPEPGNFLKSDFVYVLFPSGKIEKFDSLDDFMDLYPNGGCDIARSISARVSKTSGSVHVEFPPVSPGDEVADGGVFPCPNGYSPIVVSWASGRSEARLPDGFLYLVVTPEDVYYVYSLSGEIERYEDEEAFAAVYPDRGCGIAKDLLEKKSEASPKPGSGQVEARITKPVGPGVGLQVFPGGGTRKNA